LAGRRGKKRAIVVVGHSLLVTGVLHDHARQGLRGFGRELF
jgi:hypothetical protein